MPWIAVADVGPKKQDLLEIWARRWRKAAMMQTCSMEHEGKYDIGGEKLTRNLHNT